MLEVGFACCIVDVFEALIVVGVDVLTVGLVVVVTCGRLSLGCSTLLGIIGCLIRAKIDFVNSRTDPMF